jgi:hypothetical protein
MCIAKYRSAGARNGVTTCKTIRQDDGLAWDSVSQISSKFPAKSYGQTKAEPKPTKASQSHGFQAKLRPEHH